MTIRALGPLLAAVAIATGSCSPGVEAPRALVVDSAGTRIVTYDLSDADAPVYRVVAEHDLEIGVLDGDPAYTFSTITDLALSERGQVLVSDAVSQEIRVFDATGTYESTVGGSGDGPGEFAVAPSIVDVPGDTVFAYDGRNRRISAFSLTGELLTEVTLRTGEGGRPQAVRRLDDGSYLSQSTWINPDVMQESHDVRLELDSIVIEHLDVAGLVLDTLRVVADRPRARRQEVTAQGFRTIQAVPPYAAQAQMRSDGARLVLAHQDALRIDWIEPSGHRPISLRVLGVQHPASAEEIRARQEADIRAELGHLDLDPLMYKLNLEFLPERLPPLGRVVVSDAGDVWVALTEYDHAEGLDWLVFTPTGELRGTVHTPAELRLREVRHDFLVGFVLSDLDVPYVRRYPLSVQTPG